MDHAYFRQKLAPILRDKLAWDAFLFLLDMEHKKLVQTLEGKTDTDTLIRINAKLQLIANFKKAREHYAKDE